jgi:DNA-binding transcriptional regulator YbjK
VATTRTRALDAGIDLLATGGLRALTHTRVDDRAGLPRGSTSNHFRTRDALWVGVADRILERELEMVDATVVPVSTKEFVDALCGLYAVATGPMLDVTTARMVLFVAGSSHPALRAALSRGREVMIASAERLMRTYGATDPATAAVTLAAVYEGMLLHAVARGDDSDPRPALDLVARAVSGEERPPTPRG